MKNRLFLFALVLTVTWATNAIAGFQIYSLGTGNGHIKIICEPGTTISLDDKQLMTVKPGNSGVFLKNVSAGIHIVSTEQQGFTPESWPIEVINNKIAEVQATQSSPTSHDSETARRTNESFRHTESKHSLVERNQYLNEIRKNNDRDEQARKSFKSLGWCGGKSCNSIKDNLTVSMRIHQRELIDSDGRTHSLEVWLKTKGKGYYDRQGFMEDGKYVVDISGNLEILYDGQLVDTIQLNRYSCNGSSKPMFDKITSAINHTQKKEYKLHPFLITLYQKPAKKKETVDERIKSYYSTRVKVKSLF